MRAVDPGEDEQLNGWLRDAVNSVGDWFEGAGDWIADKAADVWEAIKTIGAAPARGAFLLLMKMNILPGVQRGFDDCAQALKERAEA